MVTKAKSSDEKRVVDLLSLSFKGNASVGFLCGQGEGASLRVRRLMG